MQHDTIIRARFESSDPSGSLPPRAGDQRLQGHQDNDRERRKSATSKQTRDGAGNRDRSAPLAATFNASGAISYNAKPAIGKLTTTCLSDGCRHERSLHNEINHKFFLGTAGGISTGKLHL